MTRVKEKKPLMDLFQNSKHGTVSAALNYSGQVERNEKIKKYLGVTSVSLVMNYTVR